MFGSYLHFTFAFKKVSYFSKYFYSTSVKDMDLLKMSKLSVNKLCEKICCATKKITRNQNKYSNRIMHNCTNWKSHWINMDYWHKNQPVTKSHFTWAKISPYLKTFSLKTTQHFPLSQDISTTRSQSHFDRNIKMILSVKKLYDRFYGWGSTASRLQSHYEGAVYFLLISPQEILVLIWSTSAEWKTDLTLKLPPAFEPGTQNR